MISLTAKRLPDISRHLPCHIVPVVPDIRIWYLYLMLVGDVNHFKHIFYFSWLDNIIQYVF
jgi:hypothetical protein